MAEWSNAAVLKTVDLRGSGGSNPSLSAKKKGRFVCLSLLKQAKRSFLFEQGASGNLLGLRRNSSFRIFYLRKIQSCGRNRLSSGTAITIAYNTTKFVNGHSAATNFKQSANYCSNHIT